MHYTSTYVSSCMHFPQHDKSTHINHTDLIAQRLRSLARKSVDLDKFSGQILSEADLDRVLCKMTLSEEQALKRIEIEFPGSNVALKVR